jgi:hypothetical protein
MHVCMNHYSFIAFANGPYHLLFKQQIKIAIFLEAPDSRKEN